MEKPETINKTKKNTSESTKSTLISSSSTSDPMRFVREDFRTMEKYVGVSPLEVIADEIGVDINDITKLDANENLYGPPKQFFQAIESSNMHIYPDPSQSQLRKEIAKYMGVESEDMVVAGSGSDDMIDIIIRLVKPGPVIISTPTFGMYSYLSKIMSLPIIDVPRKPPPNFELDMDNIIKTIREKKASLIFLVSPNNPTGNIVPNDEIERICKEDVLVVVDEAYAEFSKQTATGLLSKYSNLIILRTFSKWAGLAGLRSGFAVAHPTIINIMLSSKQPYNVNVAADFASRVAIQLKDVIAKDIDAILEEKLSMMEKLKGLKWIDPLPSSSNFMLCKVDGVSSTGYKWSAGDLRTCLRKLGVLIRYFEKPQFMSDYIRITAARRKDTDALMNTLKLLDTSVLLTKKKQLNLPLKGIVFDMDGVLADESVSYRQAIIKTAHSFGVNITEEYITEFKAQGGSNNDWIATKDILSLHGVTISLDNVTERFEQFYQGTTTVEGLWKSETLIPKRSLIKYLASKVPLTIVTGRPRNDAERFLTHHGIREFFGKLVCMEDAPSKPDPKPVLMALESINITSDEDKKHIIMIGDTPNDVIAATKAGIHGFGVLAPKEKGNNHMRESIVSHGGLLVLNDLEELRLLL